MRAGKLQHRITIQQATEVLDAVGQATMTWATYGAGPIWAAVEPLSGRELWNAQQVQPLVTHRVRIRHLSGVTPKMRILFGTRTLGIGTVLNLVEDGVEDHLLCSEAI